MTRVNGVLLLALIASSLGLVKVSYDSRRLFTELDRARARAQQLDSERERLQLDARAEATPLRVEKVARDKLAMRSATPAVTEYVAPPPRAASPTAAAAELRR